MNYIQKVAKEEIFWNKSGAVELWDFSRANLNDEARIEAITKVASVCYHNPKIVGSEKLYNRLAAESIGLPSSSFEFVPVLLDSRNPQHKEVLQCRFSNVIKYGQPLTETFFLTNYRALVYDWEKMKDKDMYSFDIRTIYNTEEECALIKEFFPVYLFNIDLVTRSQMVRHRTNWQELSRRYVSGDRVPFELYVDETSHKKFGERIEKQYQDAVDLYNDMIKAHIKPEKARRVIPFGTMTKIWGAFPPDYLSNFFSLRRKGTHAQSEVQEVAEAMFNLLPSIQYKDNLKLIGGEKVSTASNCDLLKNGIDSVGVSL